MTLILPKGPRRSAHGGTAKQLVVFLHGYGSDGDDLIDLAGPLAPLLPDAAFASPHAPHPCEMGFGWQWFGLQEPGVAVPAINLMRLDTGSAEVRPVLDAWIDALLDDTGVPPEKLALVGFSQGAMMALEVGLRRAVAPAAIVGFSGALTSAARLPLEIRNKAPVLLVHGLLDPVVPAVALQMSQAALAGLGVPVETLTRPHLGHSIDQEGLSAAARFLARHLV